MDIEEFVTWWGVRERGDLEAMIADLDGDDATADAAICRLRATAAVGALLRRSGQNRLGCRAAHLAGEAALEACASTGVLSTDRSGATRLARAAADAARGLVVDRDSPAVAELLRPFRPHLAGGAAA